MSPEERAEFIAELTAVFQDSGLSADEVRWVKLAIHKQEQSIALRQAVIEKTFAGLVWSAIIGLGYIMVDFLRNHGLKI
jgi:hypothetical protein